MASLEGGLAIGEGRGVLDVPHLPNAKSTWIIMDLKKVERSNRRGGRGRGGVLRYNKHFGCPPTCNLGIRLRNVIVIIDIDIINIDNIELRFKWRPDKVAIHEEEAKSNFSNKHLARAFARTPAAT